MGNKWTLALNPCVFGMNYHDPSAALFKNETLICAIEEEKLNRIKNTKGVLPINAIKKCCEQANIDLKDLDNVSIGYNPERRKERISMEILKNFYNNNIPKLISDIEKGKKYSTKDLRETVISLTGSLMNTLNKEDLSSQFFIKNKLINELGVNLPIYFYDHHFAHAASAYYPSGFSEALIIVIDGIGEFESLSIWKGEGKEITKLDCKTIPYSLGYIYALFTAYLGFSPWQDEGKTMALAPYGEFDENIWTNINHLKTTLVQNSLGEDLEIDINKGIRLISNYLSFPPRNNKDEINREHKNLAYTIQYFLENEVKNIISEFIEKYQINNICTSGGVFLNCKLNGEIREMSEVNNTYFQPVSGDAGLALGAGLLTIKPKSFQLPNLNIGPSFKSEEIERILKDKKLSYNKFEEKDNEFYKYVAQKIQEENIILWFSGGIEFGPRALGSRSILADPRKKHLADRINEKIKNREKWRPFATSILYENAGDVLKNFNNGGHFMIESYEVQDKWKEKIKGVMHSSDNTTRPQVVKNRDLPEYYNLINHFYLLTGTPMILNTSLNDKGEPIIFSPTQALKLFFSSSAEILVLENFILEK